MKFVFVMAVAAAVTPFPLWLTEFTGLTEWPGMDPPYIPLDFINFNAVPNVPLHPQTDCTRVRNHCLFDCFHCVTADEVYTCPVLSQTFDDGPTPHTNTLLDLLSHPTTFFTLGINVVRWPEIYQRAMREGHLMALHTWSHKYLPSLTNEQIVAQLQWSIWAQNATGNHLPKWFRPPFGGIDNRVRAILRQFGMQAVLWDFDTFDWRLLTDQGHHHEEVVYRDLAAFRRDRGGRGLILEHDHLEQTVRVAINIDKRIVGGNQWAVNQCVNNPLRYIKEF